MIASEEATSCTVESKPSGLHGHGRLHGDNIDERLPFTLRLRVRRMEVAVELNSFRDLRHFTEIQQNELKPVTIFRINIEWTSSI